VDPKPKVDPKQKKGELVWGSKTAKMAPTARAERSTTGRKRPAGQSQQTQKRTSSGQNQQQRAKTRATSAPSFGAPHRPPLQHADSSRIGLTRGSPSRRRFFLGSFSSSADSSPLSSPSFASSSSHSSMKSPPTKACELRSENATWSGYVFTFTLKPSPKTYTLPPK